MHSAGKADAVAIAARPNLKPDESILSRPAWKGINGPKFSILIPKSNPDPVAARAPRAGTRRKVRLCFRSPACFSRIG